MICAACGKSFNNDVEAVRQNHEPCASKLAESAPSASANNESAAIALLQRWIDSYYDPDSKISPIIDATKQLLEKTAQRTHIS